MALEGHCPKIFLRKSMYDVPVWALLASSLPGALAYMVIGVTSYNAVRLLCSVFSSDLPDFQLSQRDD